MSQDAYLFLKNSNYVERWVNEKGCSARFPVLWCMGNWPTFVTPFFFQVCSCTAQTQSSDSKSEGVGMGNAGSRLSLEWAALLSNPHAFQLLHGSKLEPDLKCYSSAKGDIERDKQLPPWVNRTQARAARQNQSPGRVGLWWGMHCAAKRASAALLPPSTWDRRVTAPKKHAFHGLFTWLVLQER